MPYVANVGGEESVGTACTTRGGMTFSQNGMWDKNRPGGIRRKPNGCLSILS